MTRFQSLQRQQAQQTEPKNEPGISQLVYWSFHHAAIINSDEGAMHAAIRQTTDVGSALHTSAQGLVANVIQLSGKGYSMTWAQRLKRVFAIEIEKCGGKVKIIACIEGPGVIEKVWNPTRLGGPKLQRMRVD